MLNRGEAVDFDDIEVGDYLNIEINGLDLKPRRHLSGDRIRGTVVEKNDRFRQCKFDTGWCFHEHDMVVEHRRDEEENGDG